MVGRRRRYPRLFHRAHEKRSAGLDLPGARRRRLVPARDVRLMFSPLPAYAELHCVSNFTFLRGASHPEEQVSRAAALGYSALALTDECSVAGAARAHVA